MKRYILLVISLITLSFFIQTCTKSNEIVTPEPKNYQSRSVFNTYMVMPPDKTISYSTFDTIKGHEAYLNTCGVSPEYESPNMGVEFYTIDGPTNSTAQKNGLYYVLTNLTSGTYKVVGHAYVIGYRPCDDSVMNDNAYDTMNLRIKSNVQANITSITKSKSNLLVSYQISSNTTTPFLSRKLYCSKDGVSFIFLKDLSMDVGSVTIKPVRNCNLYKIEVIENNQYFDTYNSPLKSY